MISLAEYVCEHVFRFRGVKTSSKLILLLLSSRYLPFFLCAFQ